MIQKKLTDQISERKVETFVYEDLGFPITLIDAPMKKIFGKWFIDINLADLQINALNALIHKPNSLSGAEIRFIRKYFEMTQESFGKIFNTTQKEVLNWENDVYIMNPTLETFLRLYVFDRLHKKDKEFRKFYHEILKSPVKPRRRTRTIPIKIEASRLVMSC